MTRQPGRAVTSAGVYGQELLDLYDRYAHGQISRREFLDGAARFSTGGMTAAALLAGLSPDYALAQQVAPDDPNIDASYQEYDSPGGAGKMRGYLVKPAGRSGPRPGVVVVHENRGLNPYIEDVARRVATAGFIGFAPDALTPFGGYPGNDDDGRALQRQRDRAEMLEDFIAAVGYLAARKDCDGKVAAVGFCFGGWVCNQLAVRIPDLCGSVPFYGGQPDAADVAKIRAPLLLHFGELDTRVNEGWPAYRQALDEAGKEYQAYTYAGANHGFHNDTTPRYDRSAAELAWSRTIEFFNRVLV